MRHAWKYAAAFGFITAALSAACTVTTDDDVSTGGSGGTSTSGGTGGTNGGTGGTSASGGTGGSTGGTGGSTGGTSGTGGSTGGSAGTGGSTGGTGGSTGGTGGTETSGTGGTTGGTGGDTTATCDPADGSAVGTPYPDCEPQDTKDDCEVCIQKSCCEESKNCYATEPFNVCGWGGPPGSDGSVAGEIACYRDCLTTYVNDNGVCDSDGISGCATMCATPMCGGDLVGGATSDLAACMQTNCSKDCFGADACDAG